MDKGNFRKKQTDIVHFVTFAIVGITKENPIIAHIYMKIGTNNTAITYEIDISNMEKKLFKESNITCTQYAVLIIFIVLQICSCKNRTVNRKS